jgi:hypothetical protein
MTARISLTGNAGSQSLRRAIIPAGEAAPAVRTSAALITPAKAANGFNVFRHTILNARILSYISMGGINNEEI